MADCWRRSIRDDNFFGDKMADLTQLIWEVCPDLYNEAMQQSGTVSVSLSPARCWPGPPIPHPL